MKIITRLKPLEFVVIVFLLSDCIMNAQLMPQFQDTCYIMHDFTSGSHETFISYEFQLLRP